MVRSLLLFLGAGMLVMAADHQSLTPLAFSPSDTASRQFSLKNATQGALVDLLKGLGQQRPAQLNVQTPNVGPVLMLSQRVNQCAEPLLLAAIPNVDPAMPQFKTSGNKLDPMTVKPMPVCSLSH